MSDEAAPPDGDEVYFLASERLVFRRWRETDIDFAQRLWGDPRVTRYLDARPRLGPDEVRDRLELEMRHEREHGVQYWPCLLLETGESIGCCGLRPYPRRAGALELGFHVLPAFQGRGLATEAAAAVVGYAFAQLHAPRLYAGHHPDNTVSARVLRKLGFEFLRTESYPPTGAQHPLYVLERPDDR